LENILLLVFGLPNCGDYEEAANLVLLTKLC